MLRHFLTACLISVAILGILSACASDSDRTACPGKSSDQYFFARGTFDSKDAHSDEFRREWYSKHLLAMGEPSLSCGMQTRNYRFIWLRSFHSPVAVRIVESDNQAILVATELNGAGGYDPGAVKRRKELVLSESDLQKLHHEIGLAKLWTTPTREETSGLDGARWIIEASDKGRYHVIDRWTPENGPIRELGLSFLNLTGWHFAEEEIY